MARVRICTSVVVTLFAALMLCVLQTSAGQVIPGSSVEQAESATPSVEQSAVLKALNAQSAGFDGSIEEERYEQIAAFYQSRAYEPLWIQNGALVDRAKLIVEKLSHANEHALDPEDYDLDALMAVGDLTDPEIAASYDVSLSHALVEYGQHLNAGQVDPVSINRENIIYPFTISPRRILRQASSTGNIVAYLRLLAPRTTRYERLRVALLNYRQLANAGGWEMVDEGEVLKPGMEDKRVPALRKRLYQSGDYSGDFSNPSTLYDGDIVDAVLNFQRRHGLAQDAVIGTNTLQQINISVEQRITMMELNLERRRWMQDDYGRYYVFANLADQVLKVVRDEKTVHAELIQVGQPYHRTPVFSDEMEYVELNPYWNVPKSIATKELLPELKTNPGKYAGQNYEVLSGEQVLSPLSVAWGDYSRGNFPFRIRQRPGDGNALGRIKFMFPNKFNVYIHDTPSKSKFDRAARFFSHGCLRLKDPLKMAEVILGPLGWSRAKIDKLVASKKRMVVKLDQKIPVHVAYMTAWVNKDGSVHFRRDVYGRDKILAKALEKD